jgi:hypothetical protein
MDKQDADRALDAALTDLEQSRAGADREQMAALLAAVVLIGRRLVPGRTTADDATMPGKAQRMAERRQSAGLAPYPGPAAPRVDPPRKGMRHTAVWQDEPAPALRALFTGEPIADEVPEPVGAFADSPDMDETPDLWPVGGAFGYPPVAADTIIAKDRAELAATLTELDVARRNLARERAEVLRLNDLRAAAERKAAALHSVIDEARRELARALGADADGTLTWLVSVTGSRIAADRVRVEATERDRDAWMRSFSKVGDALGCPGGEPSVLAAISTLKKERDEARLRDPAVFRNSLREALGLPGNALDSVIVAKVREAGAVLAEAHKVIETARQKLATTLRQALPLLPDLVDRAVHVIEVLRSEHALERTTVDELRGQQAEMVETTEAAKDEANEHRARWDRIQPLIAALESWATSPPGRDADTPLAGEFDRWQIAEANADDGPADVPHQPDDPGVSAEIGGGLTGVESDR